MRALAIAALACACRAAIPAVPGQGGPAWHEVASEHFVVWTDGDVDDARALVQTVEHLRQIVRQPHWFAEGLATYFETLRIADDGTFDLGTPWELRVRELRRLGPTSMAGLFTCQEARCMDSQFYATAWALFSYLATNEPDRLFRLVQRLAEVPRDAQDGVFAEVFPDLTPAKLDGLITTWIKVGDVRIHRFHASLRSWPTTVRALGDADVLAVRGLLRYARNPRGPMPSEVTAAIAAEPTNVLAHVVEWMHAGHGDLAAAHAVAAAHPDDWRAWWLVMMTTASAEERDFARGKMCATLARNPAVLPKTMCW